MTFWSLLTSAQNPKRRTIILTMVGVFLLNLVIKGMFLNEPPFGMDEPFTLFRAQKQYLELIQDLASNNHPPLFESIVWVWLRIVGYDIISLRILPLVFSALAAAMLFKLGQRYFSFFAGLLAALIFTFSLMHIYFSHELRSYPLLALLTIISMYIYLGGNNKSDRSQLRKNWWWLLAIVNAILLYTHYFSVFLLLAQGVHALFFSKNRATRAPFIKACVISVFIYIPQVILVYSRWAEKVENGHWLGVPGTDALFNQLSNFLNVPTLSFISILILLSGLHFVNKTSYDNRGIRFLLLLFPGIFFLMWGLSQWLPVFHDRYLSFTTIGLFLMLAIVIDNYPKRIKPWMGLALIVTMAATTEYKPVTNQEMGLLIDELNKERETGDRVLLYPAWGAQCFSFHYNLEYFKNYIHLNESLAKDRIIVSYQPNSDRIIAEAAETHKLILVNYDGPPGNLNWKEMEFDKPKKFRSIKLKRHSIFIIEDMPIKVEP